MLGCAQQQQQQQQQPASAASRENPAEIFRISYSVGPCNGQCPVYQVAVEADGSTYFNGDLYTQVEGQRRLSNQALVFQRVQSRLAALQPVMGATSMTVDCEPRATDLPLYTVVWTSEQFEKAALEHDTGCHSAQGRVVTDTLKSLDALLGVDELVGSGL